MTSILESRRKAWDVIFSDPNLSLNSLKHRAVAGTVCQNGLRSICWKIFLGYLPTLEVSTWPAIQLEERQRYTDLKRKYIDEPAEKMNKKGEEDLVDNNPLALNESNPWQQFFADTEIRKVIRQDVERTFPDVDFFRQDDIQQKLTDILFIYCKLNRDVSYRQGMHELLAPFYWTLSLESIDNSTLDTEPSDPAAKLMTQVLDSAFVEQDAYILFNKLMTYGKSWYEFNEEVPNHKPQMKSDILSDNIPKPPDSAGLNPVVMTCHRIHHQYLKTVDPLLYEHLENFGIEPQLYGIRWIRLLFGREFDIYELLKLWDAIFAQDATLKIAEYVCVAILLHMRDQLLQKEYAECLTMLMRPPQINKPASLVEQAKYLQDNLSSDTALHILQQNDVRAGKEPRTSLSDGVVKLSPPPTRQQLQQRTLQHRSSQGSNLDFAKITSGMMKNPQMRDINKAIAGVMGTVQKNVNTFGENVLGRADGPYGPRRSTVSSEFPSGIDRVATSFKQDRATPVPAAKVIQDQRTKHVNQQMGDIMAKCLSLLENEIFSVKQTQNNKQQEIVAQEEPSVDNKVPNVDDSTNQDETEEKEPVEYEGSNAGDEDNKQEENTTVQDEAKIIMALAGLKHVRDVLLGKQQFDASVMDLAVDDEQQTVNTNKEWKWDVVDRKEAILNSPTPPASDHPQPTLKNTSVFVPPSSSSIIANDGEDSYEKNKPLPPIITQKPLTPIENKLSQVPITYISANPTPPRQTIKYRIEDLLSDPDLQLTSPKSTTDSKFKWMLADDNQGELKTNSQDLFKSEQPKMSPRKRSSFIIKKASIDRSSEHDAIDPLDAKNVDNRRAYEYDMF